MTQIKHERSTQDLVRAAVSGWLGTALEFMDFQLYSLGAALVFHEIFFPELRADLNQPIFRQLYKSLAHRLTRNVKTG